MRRLAWGLTAIAAWLLLTAPAGAQTVQLAPYGGQDFNQPFYVTGAPGDPSRVFVVEAAGTIRLVKNAVTQPTPFLDISGAVLDLNEGPSGCECGMFSMALAPDYSSSGLFYVYYTRDVGGGNHNLVVQEFRRAASNPDVADPASGRTVLEIAHPDANNHNGGQLQFGPDKLLYLATGDGGTGGANAQNPASLLGKLLRIDPKGIVPFEIYSSGLRNPYRFSFDRSTGDLTIGDVGESTWEEIDFEPEGAARGLNFGWPCFEGPAAFSACSVANYAPPAFFYGRSGSAAVTGGYVIRDSALPSLAGRYIYTDSQGTLGDTIRTVRLSAAGSSDDQLLPGVSAPSVVSFGEDACGHIYAASITGPVYQLQPTSGSFPCKTAPDLTLGKVRLSNGSLVVGLRCDEDCDVNARADIAIGKGKGKSGASSAMKRKKRKKPPIVPRGASGRFQAGADGSLSLSLSKQQLRRIGRAARRGRRVRAHVEVSATGGGGGTETENALERVRTGPKKKKGKRKG